MFHFGHITSTAFAVYVGICHFHYHEKGMCCFAVALVARWLQVLLVVCMEDANLSANPH